MPRHEVQQLGQNHPKPPLTYCLLQDIHAEVRICCAPVQDDLEQVARAGRGRVDITVGSALDIFGGKLSYEEVVAWHSKAQQS